MEAALFQDTPALLAAQLDPKTQKAAEEAFAQQQRSNPRQLASELVACLGNASLSPAVRQLAATLAKRFTAPRRALGALGEWNAGAVEGFRNALWQALASGPEPPVARALCVAVAEEASDATQPWPAASSNCVAGLNAAPGSPQATVALTLCAALADGDDAKVGLAGDASISEVMTPLQQHLSSDAETGVLAVKAACTLAIRCSSAARKQVLAPSLAKAVLQATQVFLTKDESKGVECLDALVDAAGEAPAFLAADAGQLLGLVGAAANAAQFEPETRSRALEVALALAEAAPAVARRHASDVVTNVIPVAVGLSRTPEDITPEEWAAQPCPLLALADCDDEGEHVRGGDQALRRLAATLGKKVAPKLLGDAGPALASERWEDRRAALASLHALALGAPKELKVHLATVATVASQTFERYASGNEDPRCVLEACRLVGALSCASGEPYQRAAAKKKVPSPLLAIAQALSGVTSGRVAGALCAAASLYATAGNDDVEEQSAWVEDSLNVLVPALARALGASNGDASAQKAVLEAIGAIASRADSVFGPHYATLMPLLAQALQGTQASQSEEVAQMRARAIECAAAIGAAVPSQFRNDAPAVLTALVADASVPPPTNDTAEDDVDDLALSTLLPAAIRIVATCGAQHLGDAALEAVAKPLLVAAQAETQISHSNNVGDEDVRREASGIYSCVIGGHRVAVNLRAIWGKEKACDLLGELAEACGPALPPSVACAFASALASNQTCIGAEAVRSTASCSLAQVAGSAVSAFREDASRKPQASALIDGALRSTSDALQAERSDEARPLHVRALSDVLEHVAQSHVGGLEAGLLEGSKPSPLADSVDDQFLDSLVKSLIAAAKESDTRRDKVEQDLKADGAFDDDDGDALAEALEAEDQLQENVVNAIGWALKAKRDAFADSTFKSTVLPHYAPVLTKANAREKDVHAALCTLIDVVEHGGASGLVAQAAPTVLGVSLRLVGARETSAGVRATAAYGVAVVARKCSDALKAVDVNQACAVLKAVVDAGGASADDDDDEETKARAVENAANAVVAVADALYAPDSSERQQLVGWWLGALPFEEDDEEARRAHRTLVNGLERGDPALRAHLPLVTARLADALSTLEGSPPSSPTKPCETPLDSNTAQRAVRALKGVNAEQPAAVQAAYAGLMKPAQEALQKALASA
jgi:hypothetical protein